MALHYNRDGYSFSADAASLFIDPGPNPITLTRSDLEQLGLAIRDDYQVPLSDEDREGHIITGILSTLAEVVRKLEGPRDAWARRNLRRAMTLIGGLDEKMGQEILDQEGV